ncbi:unnamed protein product [Schistosoma haematobium]|nr:unnamed protein product [Schistosoma haematobium]CAH8566270.1 unnamed protein product [Schistosoma haematobium]
MRWNSFFATRPKELVPEFTYLGYIVKLNVFCNNGRLYTRWSSPSSPNYSTAVATAFDNGCKRCCSTNYIRRPGQ